MTPRTACITLGLLLALGSAWWLAEAREPAPVVGFMQKSCVECHNADSKRGGLDLSAFKLDPADPESLALAVTIHDRVASGEMPPKGEPALDPSARKAFLESLARPIVAADEAKTKAEGRATWRRLNRYEYENSVRDLLAARWLQIREMLPEDGEAHRFNKVGDALDVSHVQIARYLAAAEYALHEVSGDELPKTETRRFYARECGAFTRRVYYTMFNRSPERATFPIVDFEADVPVLEQKAPMTDPARKDREAMGVVASTYEPLEIKFDAFKAKAAGRYKIRLRAYSFWAGPESEAKWWRPERAKVSKGRTREPVSLYAETPPRLLRKLGTFEFSPEPSTVEFETHLLAGETIRPDAVRLFRSRPPGGWHNPLAEKDGQPGVAFAWLEVTGPILDEWPTAGRKLLFGGDDAEKLMRGFVAKAVRRPIPDAEIARYLRVVNAALDAKVPFPEAMIAGYSAVLCSPAFVTLAERPGPLDDHALASRLSYFLWNSPPDAELRALADAGKLRDAFQAQTTRLLADAKSSRFVEAFLDYWLDLRKINANSPDSGLYSDYYLDDFLVESSVDETRAYFAEVLGKDLPARTLVASDFAMVNERLATLYGLKDVRGVDIRRVPLPAESVRGGLLTQASVLKVTANGTTTSPVLRGVWIAERILGQKIPPPPAAVPAVEPDTRGATTIREQLDKHRSTKACNACHAKIDPPGFALENFDVAGAWRDTYRALGEKNEPRTKGHGKNGQPFEFHDGPKVDAAGALGEGRNFADVREFKRLLLADERAIARNLANQLVVYATGAGVRFGDRAEIEAILDRARPSGYGVRTLIREVIQSRLFRWK